MIKKVDKKPNREQSRKGKNLPKLLGSIGLWVLVALALSMMIFTIFSVNTFNRNDRSIFGHKLYIVLSDSMSATDFDAGDLIVVKETDPRTLRAGDIIAFTSRGKENYGETIAHKIRRVALDEDGNPGFVTYGTTTGEDDDTVVSWSDIHGKYRMHLPKVGSFFAFIKTLPGYLLLILLPFLILIFFQGASCVKLFKEYREEEMEGIRKEREKLKEEREATLRMLRELESRKEELHDREPGDQESEGKLEAETQSGAAPEEEWAEESEGTVENLQEETSDSSESGSDEYLQEESLSSLQSESVEDLEEIDLDIQE